MRKKIILLAVLFAATAPGFAQKKVVKGKMKEKRNMSFPTDKKTQLFGVHFNLADFNSPNKIKNNSQGINATTIRDMSKGFSVSYMKGITRKIDFMGKVNAMFHDYGALYYNTPGKTEIGLELEPSLLFRPINDDNLWSPFATVGVGGGMYTNHIGAYVPLGIGLQLNWSGTTYMFLQAQYKIALSTKVLKDNIFYSVGFAESF